jgi:hypothetical protein
MKRFSGRNPRALWALLFLGAMGALADAAWAGIPEDVARVFELSGKIRPGMTLAALNELLGPPAREKQLGGTPAVTRYMWLHGEMGIEAYFAAGAGAGGGEGEENPAHRVNIVLPCRSGAGALKAMDALTRQGQSKYGSIPRFDHTAGEYYWIADGVRFAFSKYDRTTVLCASTRER